MLRHPRADDDLEVLKNIYGPEQGYSGRYKDDLTGQLLKDEVVLKARWVELDYFIPRVSGRRYQGRTHEQPLDDHQLACAG